MTTLVLDTGALIALDRRNRELLAVLEAAFGNGDQVRVPTGTIGQAWRDPSRQAVLSRTFQRCEEVTLNGSRARAAGRLCGSTETSDVIDASVAITVADSGHRTDRVMLFTSDRRDMQVLLSALDSSAHLIDI